MFDIKLNNENIVYLTGRFDASQSEKVANVLNSIKDNCVIDFKDLEYISSAGLGLLVKTYTSLKLAGKSINLINMNKHINEVFKYAGLDKVFSINQLFWLWGVFSLENEDFITINNCLNGNGRSYEIIVNKYQKMIFRLANKFVKDFDDAEEITQSVFVKAYENLNKYNPKYKFFSWLYRITINEAINFEKRKKNKGTIDINTRSLEYDPDRMFDNNALSENITDALMNLDMIYRVPVVLKHFLDYSYKELSDLLDIPEKTVKSRLFTGRQLLKEILTKKRVV